MSCGIIAACAVCAAFSQFRIKTPDRIPDSVFTLTAKLLTCWTDFPERFRSEEQRVYGSLRREELRELLALQFDIDHVDSPRLLCTIIDVYTKY